MLTNICVNFDPRYNKYEFWYRSYPPTLPHKLVAKPIEFEKAYEGVGSPPFLSLSYEEAQELVDQLWEIGLRPTGYIGERASKEEIEKFLDKLRELI